MNLQHAIDRLKDSPLQQINSPLLAANGIELSIKRDDLLDPALSGNKWRKLKYNLIEAAETGQDTLLTFGGAWSNHIYATAAAGEYFGFKTIGVIRGEKPQHPSQTLQFASAKQMRLKYISRADYGLKNTMDFIDRLHDEFGDFYHIPEGGNNTLALRGVSEIIDETGSDFDVITTACGTGATLAGLVSALTAEQQATGYAVLKGGDFLCEDVDQLLTRANVETKARWAIETAYHFGGYAKTSSTLLDFIRQFQQEHAITLDAVYTGKMFYGLFDQIGKGRFEPGTRIIALHTGGLQGNAGFEALNAL